jgi:hypothetical protein
MYTPHTWNAGVAGGTLITAAKLNEIETQLTLVTPKWQTATVYAIGDQVVSPGGDIVTSLTAHTSTTYVPGNWKPSATFSQIGSDTPPTSPAAGQVWLSSRFKDVKAPDASAHNRVLSPGGGTEGAWLQEPQVWVANGLFNMLYTGGVGPEYLFYASCPETSDPTIYGNWTKVGIVIGNSSGGGQGALNTREF